MKSPESVKEKPDSEKPVSSEGYASDPLDKEEKAAVDATEVGSSKSDSERCGGDDKDGSATPSQSVADGGAKELGNSDTPAQPKSSAKEKGREDAEKDAD